MILTERIYAQALTLAGELDGRQSALLRVLCQAAKASLAGRLRSGLTPEDCMADFVTAAGLMALAALSETGDTGEVERFTAGDVTIQRKSGCAAANCLRNQAWVMMAPYLKDRFAFQGV